MRVVLYADDMEPITVLDLTHIAEEYLNKYGMARIPVMSPTMFRPYAKELDAVSLQSIKTVDIFAETLFRNGNNHMILFTRDEESAMLLKCAFLPGQQSGLQSREKAAFARGFVNALMKVGLL